MTDDSNRIPVVRATASILLFATAAAACAPRQKDRVPLVAATTTMTTAWQVPQNPLDDKSLGDTPLAQQIRWGYKLFVDTPHEAPRFTGGKMACSNCHLNAGQRERALPVAGVAGMFPEYNARAARLISLPDRVVDCFLRSENGTEHADQELPSPAAKEVLALSAYITWLSRGEAVGKNPPWRGQNTIPPDKLIKVDALDPARGEAIYTERCQSCHGADGQGVQIGDKKAGPLWGPDSWNDGAGAARTYTLAGIIKYSMPYLDPGGLSEADAQQVAAYITSKDRPVYPFKNKDYSGGKVPVDAVYYHREAAARGGK